MEASKQEVRPRCPGKLVKQGSHSPPGRIWKGKGKGTGGSGVREDIPRERDSKNKTYLVATVSVEKVGHLASVLGASESPAGNIFKIDNLVRV